MSGLACAAAVADVKEPVNPALEPWCHVASEFDRFLYLL